MNCPDNLMILLTTHRTEVYVNTDFDKKQAIILLICIDYLKG